MEKLLTLPEFAILVSYSKRTIFKLIKENKIKPFMIRNGRNYFIEEQAKELRTVIEVNNNERYSYGYYRVSSNTQKDHLYNQLQLIESYAASKGIILKDSYKDLGSGMNFNRKNFNKLIELICNNKVDVIIVTYEDRLMRFGFDLFKQICSLHGTEIIVINSKTTSPEEEMVEDLMTIIHVFSSRLYGLRSNKGKINDLLRKDEVKAK
jgi:putative resolvase